MRLLKADFTRRIALPGVAQPVPRPVDIDAGQSGFETLRTLRIYRFDEGTQIEGHAEEDEVLIVVVRGEIELLLRSVDGPEQRDVLRALDPQVQPAPCAAYLPAHGEYRLTARSTADVAYARATPSGSRPLASFASGAVTGSAGSLAVVLDVRSHPERLRLQLLTGVVRGTAISLWDKGACGREALLHVRCSGAGGLAVCAEAQRLPLESWDTVVIAAGERARLEARANVDVLGLLVWAE